MNSFVIITFIFNSIPYLIRIEIKGRMKSLVVDPDSRERHEIQRDKPYLCFHRPDLKTVMIASTDKDGTKNVQEEGWDKKNHFEILM